MSVIAAVERLAMSPEASIDSGFRQGRDAVLRQLESRSGRDESALVDVYIAGMQDDIANLRQRALPFEVPADYVDFLEIYAGLIIDNDEFRLEVFGIGPRVEEWYGFIDSDEATAEPGKDGFLPVAALSSRGLLRHRSKRVEFYLDLAGVIQKQSVIGVGPWEGRDLPPETVLKDLAAHPTLWSKIADSFTEWLERVGVTRGAFNYF
jgi:hypothetical protein